MMTIKTKPLRLAVGAAVAVTVLYGFSDQDMDGVDDAHDRCPHTPFLAEVDADGCMVKPLYFPHERDNGSLDILIGYGFSNDDDTIDREEQHVTRFQAAYVSNDWIYSVRTAWYTAEGDSGMLDTIVKIKKRFKPAPNVKYTFGAGLRLPTHDFAGNRADAVLYASTIYYPKSGWSLFAGANYTFVNDQEIDEPLQNAYTTYVGSGYFFTDRFYLNAAYAYGESKFADYHPIKTVSSTLFYQWSDTWYVSATYSYELDDDDTHHTFTFNIGYQVW